MIRQLTTCLALLCCFSLSMNAQNFYYSPEGKTNLNLSTKKILVQFKSDIEYTQQKQILSNYTSIKTLERENVLPAPTVTLVDLQNVSNEEEIYALIKKLNAEEKVEYANHFLEHKDGTLHGITDQLVVKLFSESQFPIFENAMKSNPNVESFIRNEFELLVMEIKVKGNKNALELANEFSQSGKYQFAEPDFLRLMKRLNTNDPNVDDQWSLNNDGANTSQWGGTSGADMSLFAAWGTTTGSSSIKVAILDEGVDLNHPDLIGNMLGGYDATGQGSGGGPSGNDAHGTACAGIVASVGNNNTGGAGVAYGSKIVPVRIAYSSGTSWVTNNTWIANALNWAWQTGDADILSNSWGGGGSSSLINGAIDNAINSGRGGLGAPVLFAAGNDNGANSYPATYAPTISVIAMSMCNQRKSPSSCDGETWWGSNYGSGADIAAPGVKIFATDISGSAGYSSGDYTATFNGTSSACPNAAGVMALILSADGSLTEAQARAAIESTTDKVGGYNYSNNGSQPNGTWSNDLGYGRVNAAAAVQSVAGPATANDAGITSIVAPAGSICASSETPVVTLNNFGSNTLTSVTINYTLDGANSSYSWTGSLASGSSTNVTLPSISLSSGNHTFDASTSNPNGQADENTANDGSTSSFSSGSNNVTLSITLDNYPEETSWSIVDAGSNTVASGGTYGSQPDGSTISINVCLADGCFDFIINDTYGDGICCGYGNGSYTLTEDATGTVLASGGSFGSSETTNFCVPVSNDPPVNVSISSSNNVSCNGGSDGTATASGTGGNGTITYAWSNGATGTNASNLSAGTYTVTATSGTSTATATVTISQPSAVVVNTSGTNTSGGNNNGSATASASGGTPGYSYSWSNGGSTATINNLAPGTYTVTVTDANGCQDSGSETIIAGGSPVNVTVSSSTNVSCNGGSDGSATATAGGGNGPISFTWSNGASGSTATNLSAGTYTVTATDGNTSTAASIVITEPDAITGDITGTNASGGNNGSASVSNVAGGTAPYSYSWSNGGTSAIINNLGAGTYSVTVTDANNCQANGSVTIIDEGSGGCTYETINAEGFESGWGIWNDGGSDCRRRINDSNYAATGSYCVRLRDNTSTSVMTTDNLDLTSYDEITVDFNFYARSMESGEDFWLQISTNGGSSYTTVADYNQGVQFNNNTFYTDAVVINGPFTSNTRLRFRNDASGNSDWVYIDDVTITGCTSGTGSNNAGQGPAVTVTEDKPNISNEIKSERIDGLNLYPNPTSDNLNVEFDLAQDSEVKMIIMNLTGQVVEVQEMNLVQGAQKINIEIQRYNNGVYYIHFITKDQRISKKFMVTK